MQGTKVIVQLNEFFKGSPQKKRFHELCVVMVKTKFVKTD